MALSFDPRSLMTPGGILQGAGNIVGALAAVPAQYRKVRDQERALKDKQAGAAFNENLATQKDARESDVANSLKALQGAQAGAANAQGDYYKARAGSQVPWAIRALTDFSKAGHGQRPAGNPFSISPVAPGGTALRVNHATGATEMFDQNKNSWVPIQGGAMPAASAAPQQGGLDDAASAQLEALTQKVQDGSASQQEIDELDRLSQ